MGHHCHAIAAEQVFRVVAVVSAGEVVVLKGSHGRVGSPSTFMSDDLAALPHPRHAHR